jgi:WD40 repeat protein
LLAEQERLKAEVEAARLKEQMEKLRALQAQLMTGKLAKVLLTLQGPLLAAPSVAGALRTAVLKGLLGVTQGEGAGVNYVNTPVLAAELGIEVVETVSAKSAAYTNLITVALVTDLETRSAAASVFDGADARLVAVGLYNGLVYLYRSDGLQYYTMIEARNRAGRHRRGRKVTGLAFSPRGGQLLISTNDSRLRLVSMDDFSTVAKFTGLVNTNTQIRASFDGAGERIIAGSEDRRVLVWRRAGAMVGGRAVDGRG